MITQHGQFAAMPDIQESGECTKLIRKLRWIGLDEEARRLEQALRALAPEESGTVSRRC
jgi:hypothetical protein